jgi:prepilin-type N-terminal cleavage/methylation domain-containing protein/prepilin-type processing-associated H-X9-DG protein
MKRSGLRHARLAAFTLIELLVVIAIIAILAAILFPVFARAKAKAVENTCLSNVKELTLACISYAADYDDYYPIANSGPTSPLNEWTAETYPYVKNFQIYYCGTSPAGTTSTAYMPPPGGTGWPATWATLPPAWTSAACAINVTYTMNDNAQGTKQSMLTAPPKTLIIMEGQGNVSRGYSVTDYTFMYGCSTTAAYDNMTVRHQNGSNYGFCDGHAKWIPPDYISLEGGCTTTRCSLVPPGNVEPACSGTSILGENMGVAAIQATFSTTWAYN